MLVRVRHIFLFMQVPLTFDLFVNVQQSINSFLFNHGFNLLLWRFIRILDLVLIVTRCLILNRVGRGVKVFGLLMLRKVTCIGEIGFC